MRFLNRLWNRFLNKFLNRFRFLNWFLNRFRFLNFRFGFCRFVYQFFNWFVKRFLTRFFDMVLNQRLWYWRFFNNRYFISKVFFFSLWNILNRSWVLRCLNLNLVFRLIDLSISGIHDSLWRFRSGLNLRCWNSS